MQDGNRLLLEPGHCNGSGSAMVMTWLSPCCRHLIKQYCLDMGGMTCLLSLILHLTRTRLISIFGICGGLV